MCVIKFYPPYPPKTTVRGVEGITDVLAEVNVMEENGMVTIAVRAQRVGELLYGILRSEHNI